MRTKYTTDKIAKPKKNTIIENRNTIQETIQFFTIYFILSQEANNIYNQWYFVYVIAAAVATRSVIIKVNTGLTGLVIVCIIYILISLL